MTQEIKKTMASWTCSLDVYCPYCEHYFDIMETQEWEDFAYARIEIIQRTDLDLEIECPKCKKDFEVDEAEF